MALRLSKSRCLLTSLFFSVVAFPALRSAAIALAVEVPLLLIMTFAAVKPFAFYLSGSEEVAVVTQKMWRTIDWVPFLSFSFLVPTRPLTFELFLSPLLVLHMLRCIDSAGYGPPRYSTCLVRLFLVSIHFTNLTRSLWLVLLGTSSNRFLPTSPTLFPGLSLSPKLRSTRIQLGSSTLSSSVSRRLVPSLSPFRKVC